VAAGPLGDSEIVLVAGSTVTLCDEETLSVVNTVWPAELEAIDVLSGVGTVSLSVADTCPGIIREDDSTSGEACEMVSVEVEASDAVELPVSVARENSVKPVALSLTTELTTELTTDAYVLLLGDA